MTGCFAFDTVYKNNNVENSEGLCSFCCVAFSWNSQNIFFTEALLFYSETQIIMEERGINVENWDSYC